MMTKREIILQKIKEEADEFLEYPTADQSHVSTTSMILFVEHMLNLARTDQIKCKQCDANLNEIELAKYAAYQQNYPDTHQFAICKKCLDVMLGKDEKNFDIPANGGE